MNLFIGLIMVGAILVFTLLRNGKSTMKKPNKIKAFKTTIPLDKAVKTIIQFAQSSGYKIDDFNEKDSIIVLSDSASLTSYGNFYPVYFIKQSDGLEIEVGIKSKSIQQIGIDGKHQKCFNGIKASIYAAS